MVTDAVFVDVVPTKIVITVFSAITVVSGATDCSITRPASPPCDSLYLTSTLKPRSSSSVFATASLSPITLGTAIFPSLSIA